MPSPFRAFAWVFAVITLFGFFVGTLNLMNPKGVHIPFGPNGESAEGLDGILASTLSASVLGVVFGVVAAILALLGRAGVRKMKSLPDDTVSTKGE